jgi:hypothetical protein
MPGSALLRSALLHFAKFCSGSHVALPRSPFSILLCSALLSTTVFRLCWPFACMNCRFALICRLCRARAPTFTPCMVLEASLRTAAILSAQPEEAAAALASAELAATSRTAAKKAKDSHKSEQDHAQRLGVCNRAERQRIRSCTETSMGTGCLLSGSLPGVHRQHRENFVCAAKSF